MLLRKLRLINEMQVNVDNIKFINFDFIIFDLALPLTSIHQDAILILIGVPVSHCEMWNLLRLSSYFWIKNVLLKQTF